MQIDPIQLGLAAEKQSGLHRRTFLFSTASALAATLSSCATSSRTLPSIEKKAIALPSEPLNHQSYESYLDSLKLRFIRPDEILEPHYSRCRGVRNCLPPRTLWSNMAPTLRVVDEVRRRLGAPLIRINSAYRSPYYNSRVRGAACGSYHIQNQALDLKFACSPSSVSRVARQLRAEGYFAGGIGTYSSFVHIDTRGTNVTWWS